MQSSMEHAHPIVELSQAGETLKHLHDRVCGSRQRVHISRNDCDDICVMISRHELESLENALSIFADTPEFTSMCQMLSKILESAGVVYPQPVVDELTQ